jgi:hypothetical protein
MRSGSDMQSTLARGSLQRCALLVMGAGVITGAMLTSSLGATAASGPSYDLRNVGAYGGEPSTISDSNGVLYITSPSGLPSGSPQYAGEPPIYRSTDQGETWSLIQPADNNSGDDCLGIDQANVLHWCNLGSGTDSNVPLQGDDWHSSIAATCTTSCSWVHGTGLMGTTCGTSCSPLAVDRDWVAASDLNPQPPGYTGAEVVLMYHDFGTASEIYVNISTDGGNTFGPPIPVIQSCTDPGCVAGEVEAQGYQMCNTVPAGVGIVPPGEPHAGRIYVAWIAADATSALSGCNITMLQAFHTAWVAYSDDNGTNWTSQEAFDAGIDNDMSTPFIAFTLDKVGNPYMAFGTPVNPGPTAAAHAGLCSTESTNSTVQSDTSCSYRLQLVWCQCTGGSVSFDDGNGISNGALPGSASAAYVVDGPSTYSANQPGGTSIYPTIAAGNPGQVDVGWLHTPTIVPTDPNGKFDPGGCGGPGNGVPPNNPTFYPPKCDWFLYTAQSLNLTASTSSASWTYFQPTSLPMHYGDICNLGIFCVDPNSNRHLLDFNQETVDPTTGCAHIAYSDDNAGARADPNQPDNTHGNHVVAANQTSGPNILGITSGPCASSLGPAVPEVAWPALFASVAVALGIGWRMTRRRGLRAF